MSCKRVVAFVFSVVLCAAVFAAPASARDLKEQPYRIGLIMPFTGPVASLGNYVRKGVELAHNALPPEQKQNIQLFFEDDQFEVQKTLSAYQKLSAVGGLDAVFVIGSPPANALAPLVERKNQLLIAIGASDPTIVEKRNNSFIHWVIPPELGKLLASEVKRRGYQRIALAGAEASGTIADINAAMQGLEDVRAGAAIVSNRLYPKDQTDFKTDIAKLKTQKPDAVVVVMFPGSLSAFAKQARESNLGADLIGMETFEDESEIKAAEGALNGAWYVNASDPTAEFIAKYKAAYNEHPGWAAGNGYDALNLMSLAVGTGNGDLERVRSYLRSVKDYAGGAGTYSASGDNRFTLPAALKRVTENGFVALDAK